MQKQLGQNIAKLLIEWNLEERKRRIVIKMIYFVVNLYELRGFFLFVCGLGVIIVNLCSSRIFQWNITTSGLVSGTSSVRFRTGDLARPWRLTARGSSSSAERRPTPTVRRDRELSIGLQGEKTTLFCEDICKSV